MNCSLVVVVLLVGQAAGGLTQESVALYLARCDVAKAGAMKLQAAELAKLDEDSPAAAAAREQLQRLESAPAAPLPLSLPPKKEDLGSLAPVPAAKGRPARAVDVLEVVGPRDAIVRAWYLPDPPGNNGQPADEEPTFVDVWIEGIDTQALAAGKPAALAHVFHVVGSKQFATTCGQRSMPHLVPIDLDAFRQPPANEK